MRFSRSCSGPASAVVRWGTMGYRRLRQGAAIVADAKTGDRPRFRARCPSAIHAKTWSVPGFRKKMGRREGAPNATEEKEPRTTGDGESPLPPAPARVRAALSPVEF